MNQADYHLPADTTMGRVHLRVPDLARSLAFYVDLLGMRVTQRDNGSAELAGAENSPALLRLTERAGVHRRAPGTIGLYHFALLYPDRLDLGRALLRLFEQRVPFEGFADHGVSEAAYLTDPDGNGIELAADRPRDRWPRENDQIAMFTHTLNVNALLRPVDGDPWLGMPAATRIGHIHLHVTDLRRAEEFYVGVLGFDVSSRYGPGALFLAAGGYHHHVAVNTWSRTRPVPGDEVAGLEDYAIVLPAPGERAELLERLRTHWAVDPGDRVRDPDGNVIRIV
jgi:catechol 2,3-dioxygenase